MDGQRDHDEGSAARQRPSPASSAASDGSEPEAADPPVSGRRRFGYAGWGLTDQALSSLSNFGVGLVAVRASSAEEFGAFSVAFAASVIGIGVARALISEVYAVRYSGGGSHAVAVASLDPDIGVDADDGAEWVAAEQAALEERAGTGPAASQPDDPDASEVSNSRYPHAGGAWGAAFLLALVGSVLCAGAAALLGGSLRSSLLVLAVGMPFLVLQDVVRFVCISRGDSFGAALSDGAWVVSYAAAVAVFVVATGNFPGATAALALWIFGAACGVALGGFRMRVVPRLADGIAYMRRVWRQGTRYLVDFFAISASSQVGLYLLGWTAGLAVLGEYRTAMILVGPLNIVIMGAGMVMVPTLTRHRRRTGDRLIVASAALAGALELVALLWLGAVALLPSGVLEVILGDGATVARGLLPQLAVLLTCAMLAQGPLVCLRATGDARRGTRATVPAAPFMLLGATIGAAIIGAAKGALVVAGLGSLVSGVLAVYQLVLATRSSPIVFDAPPASLGNP